MSISSFSAVLGLSEAAHGYSGGSSSDHYPGLSLVEATGAFSNYLIRSAAEQEAATYEYNNKVSNMLVEAAYYGTPIDEDAILDEAFGNIIEAVKKFFAKVKEWISSIIAKLRMFIDKIVMTGERLVAKYEDVVTDKNLKGLTFTGYKFTKDIAGDFKTKMSAMSLDPTFRGQVNLAIGETNLPNLEQFSGSYGNAVKDTKEYEAGQEVIAKVRDCSRDKQYDNLMGEITGLAKSGGWKESLHKYFYGGSEKVEMKYSDSAGYGNGESSFGKDAVISALKTPEQFSDIQDYYEKLKSEIEKHERTITSQVDKIKDLNTGKTKTDGIGLAASYASAYLTPIKTVYSVLGDINDVKVQAVKDRNAQAKAIFSKMLSFKENKSNSDFSDDYVELFGFDGFGDNF